MRYEIKMKVIVIGIINHIGKQLYYILQIMDIIIDIYWIPCILIQRWINDMIVTVSMIA